MKRRLICPTENAFGGPSIPCAPRVSALTALRHSGRAFTAHVAESAGVPKGLCPFTFRRQPAVAHSGAEFPKTFSPKTRKKCLRYFLRGAIMRWLWGRGSAGRAMRSQRIGQGFESPRLHHHKQTASRERCRLLMVAQASGERTCARHYIKQRVSLPSHFGSHCVRFIRARGFGGGAADAFALAVARAERSARKSISSVRHPPLWRSSPRHAPVTHRKVGVLRIFM